MKKIISSIMMASIMMMSFVSCGNTVDTTATNDLGLIEPGIIHAATSPDYPPFEYLEGTEIVGFDIDLLNAVAEISGLTVEYSPLEFETIISAVQAGQFDVGMSAFTASPDRQVLFSNNYYESSQVALLPLDSPAKSLEDLTGKKIGAGLGTTGEPAARTLSEDITLVNANVALPMLLSGQLDAYVCDIGVAENAVATGKYSMIDTPISEEKVSMVFKEGNQALCDELNKSLAIFMESPEYQDLLEKHGLK